MARITLLADPSPWASAPLSVLVAAGLFAAAVVTFFPAILAVCLAVHRHGVRLARRFRQENAWIDAVVEEEAPRPSGRT